MNIDKDITLLNAPELAEAMGVSYTHILRMKRSGLPMPFGRTTIAEVLEWRKNQSNQNTEDPINRDELTAI
jgi:hypothetical protein